MHVIRIGPAAATAGPVVAAAQGVTSSLTVLLTPCDAPYMTWLVTNGSVRYTLQSAKDYARTPTGPDPGCAVGVQPARVGPAEVDAKFGFTRG